MKERPKQLGPIEVPWRAPDALVVFGLAWIGVPLVIVLLLKALSPAVPAFATLLSNYRAGDITASFWFAVIDAAAALGVVGYYLKRYGATWRDVGWRKFNVARTLLYLVIAFVAFLVAVEVAFYIVSWLVPTFNANQAQSTDFSSPTTSTGRQLSLIALVIIPPIVEETVFRGFIFPALSKWKGAVVGALLTSVLFGFAHLQYNVSLYTLLLSLILCFMYYRLRSIWPGVFLHMLNNYIAFMTILKK